MNFTNVINSGNVVCKLRITSTILPQTCVIANIGGILETNINKMKTMPTRISGHKLFLVHLSDLGHKPVISKPKRCRLTAHTKSDKFSYDMSNLDKLITN